MFIKAYKAYTEEIKYKDKISSCKKYPTYMSNVVHVHV